VRHDGVRQLRAGVWPRSLTPVLGPSERAATAPTGRTLLKAGDVVAESRLALMGEQPRRTLAWHKRSVLERLHRSLLETITPLAAHPGAFADGVELATHQPEKLWPGAGAVMA
jgi:hypothetical protein